MAYIGKKVEETELANRTVDTMTGDGSDTTMSLSATPISVNNVLVFFNGVMQRPTTDFTLSGSTITFGTAPFTGAVVVAITGEGGHIGRPSSPLPTEKFMDSAVTNAKLMSGIASSKLTGAMPALDGSALTGGGTGYTESTNDPVITTNPSTGVGTFWVNKSSGEVFCCTDATAGENVWVNIGGGSGDVWSFQGRTAGYTIGGATIDNIATNGLNSIEKYAFASSGMSVVDQGDCSVVKGLSAGHTSSTHGYVTGGGPAVPGTSTNVIERHPYASASGTTDTGDLSRADNQHGGISSTTDGFIAAGYAQNTAIGKFSYGSNAVSTNIGNVSVVRYSVAGINSTTDGYVTGGYRSVAPTGVQTATEKFSFTSGTTTAHGSVTNIGSGFDGNGISSTTHGYAIGGYIIPSSPDVRSAHIDKFSFSSTANAASIGSISHIANTGGHWSSTTHGYYYGGRHTSFYTNIERFSYASEAVESSVGTLSSGRVYPSSSSN